MFRGQVPQGNVLDFNSLESPFLGFRVIQTAYWPKFNLESVFIIKNIIIMKNLTDFRKKKVETGMNSRLLLSLILPVKWFVLFEKHTVLLRYSCH